MGVDAASESNTIATSDAEQTKTQMKPTAAGRFTSLRKNLSPPHNREL